MIKEQVKWFGEDKKKMKMQVEKKKRNGNTGHKIKKGKKKKYCNQGTVVLVSLEMLLCETSLSPLSFFILFLVMIF